MKEKISDDALKEITLFAMDDEDNRVSAREIFEYHDKEILMLKDKK